MALRPRSLRPVPSGPHRGDFRAVPTYEYKCPHCKYEFEEFQNINDDPVSECPKCGKEPHRIITGGAGFLLKGSGFYTTDNRPQSYKEAERKDKGSPAAGPDSSKPKVAAKKDIKSET